MSFPVVWLGDAIVWCWDQGFVHEALTTLGGEHVLGWDALPEGADGAAVVIPARYHVDRVDEINEHLARLHWAVVILTSDEESTFPHSRLAHPRMRLWIQTPRPGQHDDMAEAGRRFLPFAAPPGTAETLAERSTPDGKRRYDWSYAGQVNHERRRTLRVAVKGVRRGKWLPSPGFTQGLPRDDYLTLLAESKVVPCPSGPATPDSFRWAEALEAGALPLADARCPGYEDAAYWHFLLGRTPPFPVVNDWATFPADVARGLDGWPAQANRAWAWWQAWKRDTRRRLAADVNGLAGTPLASFPAPASVAPGEPESNITVLIPTSPIPSHPSTAIIEETVASVRYWLPRAEILLMIDGVRAEQENRRANYEAYVHRVLWHCAHTWGNVTPLRFAEHNHQANMTRAALGAVATPLILFVEHDTPIVTDCPIDWPGLTRPLLNNQLDMIRLHHEALILDVHQHLMVDQEKDPYVIDGCPVRRTSQWSQRPHLARSDYYRQLLAKYFPPSCSTMVEDLAHSIAQTHSWHENRLAVYAPEADTPGNIKRSLHLDGRGSESKYEMRMR